MAKKKAAPKATTPRTRRPKHIDPEPLERVVPEPETDTEIPPFSTDEPSTTDAEASVATLMESPTAGVALAADTPNHLVWECRQCLHRNVNAGLMCGLCHAPGPYASLEPDGGDAVTLKEE